LSLDFDTFATLLLFAPFAAAALAPLIVGTGSRAAGWILAIVPLGLFVSLCPLIDPVSRGETIRYGIDWVPVLGLRLDFLVDGLGLVFALLITGIGAIILVYAGSYLPARPHGGRFLSFLLLFMGAMLGLVLTDNLVALFSYWEMTAVTSFLLIGFDHERPLARRAATQAMVITGLGGLSLMAGGILLHIVSGTWTISGLAGSPTLHQAGAAYPWVFGFIAIAAFTKSAQVPFHFWLPQAMEAPTPVSAYLHSAAMVQAGIYLLARTSPLLSGTPLWQIVLEVIGGLTLLWGAVLALAQTDIKQMLAQTTIGALGLMVLLLGIGGAGSAMAVAAFFVAHALYKAGLFLVAGMLEKGAGTRDITVLRGLRDDMPIAFIAAALAGLSMFGLPPFLGYFAKELMYEITGTNDPVGIATLVVLVIGNVVFGAVGLTLALGPFLGLQNAALPPPRDGTIGLWVGAALLGLAGFSVVFVVPLYSSAVLTPLARAIAGSPPHKLGALNLLGLPFWLSVLSWVLAAVVSWRLVQIRTFLQRLARPGWGLDRVFDVVLWRLVRAGAALTRLLQHGRLEIYLVTIFAVLALVLLVPLWPWSAAPVDAMHLLDLTPYEWGALALTIVGVACVVAARSRLLAIVALGIQGLGVALVFIVFGAPDLGFTQLLIEVLSVVIVTLVMTRLHLSARDPRPFEDWLRDGAIALICGGGLSALLIRVVQSPFADRLGPFFTRNALPDAHGHNIVNVILVDFRGLDTLGEISVVMTATIAALALLRRQHKRKSTAPAAPSEIAA
jgi:multicomponent Na+:H+ antiporter subunit A